MAKALLCIPFCFLAAVGLAAFANWIGLRAWRRRPPLHWTESARLLYPVRQTAASNAFGIPLLLTQLTAIFWPETSPLWPLSGLAAMLGVWMAGYPLDRVVVPEWTWKQWGQRLFLFGTLRLSGWGLLLVTVCLMPSAFGWQAGLLIMGYLAVHAMMLAGLSLLYLRRIGLMQPAGARLQRIADDCVRITGTPLRNTWELDDPTAQAFALPITREILFTRKLLEICGDEEIKAIFLHEMAHLSESKAVQAGRVVASLMLLPVIFIKPLAAMNPLYVAGVPVAILGMSVLYQKLSQRLEKRADQTASAHEANPGVYARALYKLYFSNLLPAVGSKDNATHPHLYDRMQAAGVEPDFPRPLPAEESTWPGLLIWVAAVLAAGARAGFFSR